MVLLCAEAGLTEFFYKKRAVFSSKSACKPMNTCASSYQNHIVLQHFSSTVLYVALQDLTQISPFRSNTFNDSDVSIRAITQRG